MFRKARLRLTAWYLVIIMLVSIVFSIFIYQGLTHEVERSLQRQQIRFQHDQRIVPPPFGRGADLELFDEARNRIKTTLVLINLAILGMSGVAGYFLAGKTLTPIENMVDEQNRFVSDASHELRTPLTALKSEIEVYLRSKKHNLKDADKLLTSNLEEVNNMQALSNNLLELAQYEKPNGTFTVDSISLTEILNEALKRVGILTKQKEINVVSRIQDSLISGDRQKLTELFVILLDNSIKYSSKKSQITLTSKNTDKSIIISVADQGNGIADEDIPHIFDRFFRVDASRSKTNVKGYGLGLAIAKHIVSLHQGKITVKSKVGRGTIFSVQLPRIT